MARTTLTRHSAVNRFAYPGRVLNFEAYDSTNKNRFKAGGRDLVFALNTGASARTVTISAARDPYGRAEDVTAYSVAAGALACFGPFPLEGWGQKSGENIGYIELEASHTDIQFAVVVLPAHKRALPAERVQQVVGVEWNQGTDTWTRIDEEGQEFSPESSGFWENHPIWGRIKRVNLAADGTVNAVVGDADFALDGSNGEVMSRIPKFYVKGDNPSTNVYRWWVSTTRRAGFEVHPAFVQRGGVEREWIFIGAYEATLKDNAGTLQLHHKTGEQPITGGEIDSLAFNSGSTEFTESETLTGATSAATGDVVTWHVSSGTWTGGDAAGTVYLKQVSGTFQAEDLNGSVGGANMASATGANSALPLTIANARTYATAIGSGWGLANMWTWAAYKLLGMIFWGNMDSQSELGQGIVNKASGSGFAGEETGADSIDSQLDDLGNGTGTGTDGLTPVALFGVENPWGNVWKFVDGFNAVDDEYRIVNRDGSGALADTLLSGNYEASTAAPITVDGYISNLVWEDLLKYLFIASAVAGSSSTYIPDNQYSHDAGETNILLVGADWLYGAPAGLGALNANVVASISDREIGARAEFIGRAK